MSDADILREASTRLHQVALWFDLQADRIEVAGLENGEAQEALTAARALLGIDDEEPPCG